MSLRPVLLALALGTLAGCSSVPTVVTVAQGVVSDFNRGVAAVQRPHWETEVMHMPGDRYSINLSRQAPSTVRDDTAQHAFHQRASELARQTGAPSYQVLEYREWNEESLFSVVRHARGVIRFEESPAVPLPAPIAKGGNRI